MDDRSRYDEWEQAYAHLQSRRALYDAAKMLPGLHALLKHCERELAEAQAAYDRAVRELD